MASIMPNGARYAIATAISVATAISAVSNANPAVASATVTPPNGSIVLLTSGWPDLNGAAARTVGEVDGTSFQLENINTVDATRYPAGEGAGTYQIVSDFVTINKVRDIEMTGGEQQFFEYQYVEDRNSRQQRAPTFKSAMSLAMMIDYDPTLPQFAELTDLDRQRTVAVLRETLTNGNVIYYVGWFSFNQVPSKKLNEFMVNTATFSLTSDPVRYGV